ncbi:TPA: hypothetical protein DEP34_03245 [Candidatus Uhrbacteria bacterium]|uniref:Toprim domain-containing protein n=2 Tax=Candidatus Uhriibacteriota TaxID=1752732 RepID=A0A0G1Q945_9BACT|nr:MAG: hypothetical protein UX45_C0001G0089 [Candidatus Uhrbacteria bacterium GW2011_GWF2_46_218]KKU41347.1 MAG: hypothetical protein UX57_C0004G0051 [Candidatus Uhrbacteria bacterium GW2011_GWE2_46_68]HBK33780.1 hypothetical protein [Candidatus Uhrbacteria bacterium]HCB19379.1 hypothetical protein [Candidatus Uhrbacteria bacterium]
MGSILTVQQYLNSKNIEFASRNGELITSCLFCGGDEKRNKLTECHLYINEESGLYQCKRCGAEGNLVTLSRHLGDDPAELGFIERKQKQPIERKPGSKQLAEMIEEWSLNIPPEIKNWLLKERGLSENVIKEANIGWNGKEIMIPIYDEKRNPLFMKKRRSPFITDQNIPKYTNSKGAKMSLFGIENLKDTTFIVITEGEFDALLLRNLNIPSISSTGGAGAFNDDWGSLFQKIQEVYITYDLDDAGREGARKVGALIPHAKIVSLPEEVGEHGDITDYFLKLGKNLADFMELLKTGQIFSDIEESGNRYRELPKPTQKVSIQEWRNIVGDLFPECFAAAEAGISVFTQLLIKDVRNPFGLVYVDVPSSGKTITLNFFSSLRELAYMTDHFSPASFVSHASNKKKEDLAKIDLLPRIRHKTLIVRDLAPIFAERQENLLKSLGILTRVFDGEGYESDSGVHGSRGYFGDYTFMFLAASTPILPRVWKFMGNLGSRLFFLNLNSSDKSEDELANLLIQKDFKKKEGSCREITRELVLNLWQNYKDGIEWNKEDDPEECRRVISRCANLLAHLRGTVNVWSDGGNVDEHHHTNVVIEKPIRINQLLYNLARGHALVCERTQICNEDLWPVIEVTFNSAQYNRIKLLNVLLEYGGTITTSLVETAISCSNPTALKEIETLRVLKIVDIEKVNTSEPGQPEKIVTIKKEFDWFCSDECEQLRSLRPGWKYSNGIPPFEASNIKVPPIDGMKS